MGLQWQEEQRELCMLGIQLRAPSSAWESLQMSACALEGAWRGSPAQLEAGREGFALLSCLASC